MIRYILLSFVFMISLNTSNAAQRFEYTAMAQDAYQKAISLQFGEAEIALEQMKYQDPNNMIIYHIENYIDFFRIFINEDKEEFKRLEKNKAIRLDKIKQGPQDSPYYLYTQAEIRLQWALARLKFEEYFTAFNEVSKAYKQLTANQKKFPNFIANKKSLGILHAMIGTIPDNYKWGVKLLGGMDGTIEQGRQEIEEVLTYAKTHDFMFEEETLVMYTFLTLHLKNQSDEAWKIIKTSGLDATTNPLACFALANVAMRTGRNDEAIQILNNRPQGASFHQFHYLDYMLGLAKLYKLDPDADFYIEKYINEYRGQNYLKEAYQKLAWHYLMQGNEAAYKNNMRYCQIRGTTIIDGDKTALKEAQKGIIPDVTLLKARLLFDGGYYERAYQVLSQKTITDFGTKALQLEFTYRLGRITHKMGADEKAINFYQQTIDKGQDETYFYACNAALQMGLIYEEQGKYSLAGKYYNLCLSLSPSEYKTGLHQKAKTGKNRLKSIR